MTGIVNRCSHRPDVRSGFRNVNAVCQSAFKRLISHIGFAGITRIASCVVCALILPKLSMADAWVVQPAVALEGIYDDNLRLETEREGPDGVGTARLVGALKLARVTETVDIAGLLRVDGNYYFGDERNLDNRSNQLFDFSYFRRGELSRWGGFLSYRRDTLLRTIRAVEDPDDVTIEPDADVDEGLVPADVERQRLSLGPSWSRHLTERIQVGLSYEFSDVSFSGGEDIGDTLETNVVEYQNHILGAEMLTRVTQRDRLALLFEGRRFEADNDRKFNSYDLQTGVVHEFSETATGLLTVGARYTEFDLPSGVEDDETGFVATLGGSKRTGLTTFSGTLERTVSPSASGNLVENDQLILNVSRRLSERAQFILRSRIFETEATQDTASNANRRYIAIEPRLRYAVSPSWSLEAGYEYRRQKRFFETESGDSNAVFLSLIWERPVVVEPRIPGSSGDLGID